MTAVGALLDTNTDPRSRGAAAAVGPSEDASNPVLDEQAVAPPAGPCP